MILRILCVSIWKQMHSQKLSKNCQKGKKEVQGQPVPRSWKYTRFVGRNIQRDNFANIAAGCVWCLNPPDLCIVDWLGDLHHTTRLQFKPRCLMPCLTYSAVVPFAPVYITWTPKFKDLTRSHDIFLALTQETCGLPQNLQSHLKTGWFEISSASRKEVLCNSDQI